MAYLQLAAGGGMCIQQVASNTIRVLNAQDTPHFTFDAVMDMSVQQEGIFDGRFQATYPIWSHFVLTLCPQLK